MPIRIHAADEAWPQQFERERALLEPVLAGWLAAPVEHIGSTSVPGLPAKPIVDMMGGVRSLDEARAAAEPLAGLGYVFAEHRPDAWHFYRPSPDSPEAHTHHLHLTEVGSPLWTERLTFRNALRADPGLAARYRDLKLELASQQGGVVVYTHGKRALVVEVLAAGGITLQPRR